MSLNRNLKVTKSALALAVSLWPSKNSNMKKLAILFLIIPIQLFSQQTEKWMEILENPKIDIWELESQNSKMDYLAYDFASLMTLDSDFLGFIGSNFKRIKIEYNSVTKNIDKPEKYDIIGFSIVGNNKCDFKGSITIEQIREFKYMHYGIDEMYKDSNIKTQGLLIGKYDFKENPKQNHVGTFTGIFTLWWYLDENGIIQYDNIQIHSDGYKNNQYVGLWTEYGKSQGKVCNWGEYRIPFSDDLDIGAAEFSVNPKFLENGWHEFK